MGPWGARGIPGTSSSALALARCPGGRGSVVVRVTGSVAGWPEVAVALAKVLGPSPMGRRPAGADKRVRGGYQQLGWSSPFCPGDIIAALDFSV